MRLSNLEKLTYLNGFRFKDLSEAQQKRNSLAHGDESFSQCARDLTLSDLESIKDIIIRFLQGIIQGMEDYCDNKKYLLVNSNP